MGHWKSLALTAAVAAVLIVLNEKGMLSAIGGKPKPAA